MKIGIAGPVAAVDIAHLLDSASTIAGYEMKGASLLVTLIEELLSRGHHICVFTTEPSLEPRADNIVIARGAGLDVYFVPLRRSGFRPDRGRRGRMLDLFMLERSSLVDAIRIAKPDIVHAHWTYEFAWAAQDAGLPCLITCHDSPWVILALMRDAYRAGRLLMGRHVLRRAKHLTAVSPYLAGELSGRTAVRIEVVPNPVPAKAVAQGRVRTHGDLTHRPVRIALLINGWSKRKNATVAMSALAKLKAERPSLQIDLVGPDFGRNEAAEKWAKERTLQSVFNFHGWMPYQRAQDLLAEADLLVHPALEESFGMTVAEAMAMGVPVVAGMHAGAVPWVTGYGQGGVLVDVRSEQAIADAVRRLLDVPDLYASCSVRGRQRAAQMFSPKVVADNYLDQYSRVLEFRR